MVKRILVLVLIVVVILGLGYGYFILYHQKEIETQLRKEAELNLKVVKKENSKLKHKLEELNNKLEKTSIELQDKIAENERLQNDIEELNASLSKVENELALLKQERDVLLQKLDTQSKEIQQLQEKISALEEEKKRLLAEKEEIFTPIKTSTRQKEVKLEKIEVPPSSQTEQMPSSPQEISAQLSAEIMAYNQEYKFVVLNIGEKDGIQPGITYDVSAEGKCIARIKSDRVYESMSVFDIVQTSTSISEGMKIKLTPVE